MHWYSFQITILVHIMYIVNQAFDPCDPKSKRHNTSYYYYVSDDPKHDSLFVQYCLNLHWKSLTDAGMSPRRHIIWSDGCVGQFKSATAWFYISRYPSLTISEELPQGCSLDWHFWGSGHGKGPHDGAGACLKQSIRKEQLRPGSCKLHNAANVVDYLKTSMSRPNGAYAAAKRVVSRHFILIGKTEVSRVHSMACATVSGSRAMHSVRSVSSSNNVLLQMRDFSCFCQACIHGVGAACPNAAYVAPWKFHTLVPLSASDVVVEEEDLDQEWGADYDSHDHAANLEVGDHFAIVADPDDPQAHGAEFFILLCTRKMYIVEGETLADAWGGNVQHSVEVVEGVYYSQNGFKSNSYNLLASAGPARIYSHLVFASKFNMTLQKHKQKGGLSVYKLSDEALQKIEGTLRSRQGAELEGTDGEDLDTDHEYSESDSEAHSDFD